MRGTLSVTSCPTPKSGACSIRMGSRGCSCHLSGHAQWPCCRTRWVHPIQCHGPLSYNTWVRPYGSICGRPVKVTMSFTADLLPYQIGIIAAVGSLLVVCLVMVIVIGCFFQCRKKAVVRKVRVYICMWLKCILQRYAWFLHMQLTIASFAGILLPYIHMHTTLLCFSPLPKCFLPFPSLLPLAPSPPLLSLLFLSLSHHCGR